MARSTLDDFVLKDKLGSGSYGSVHRVVRKVDRQCYALKEIDLQGMTRKEQEECIKETQILSSLDSPYIIKYYDAFLEKGKLYICMEYASGGNLHTFINRQKQKLPEELIWRLFVQMLLGLHSMHQRKVLHRDFKTLNVFLDDKLNIKLGDLGVAKILGSQTNFAHTVVGTPYYLSPEMCEDKPYNQKSDVWALGVSLYECCTQKHPFDADNQGALILKILRGKYPPVSGYSKELVDIIRACLTLDVRKRPDTTQLLGIKAVRDHAIEMGLEQSLPPAPQVLKQAVLGIAPHLASAGGPGALSGVPGAVSANKSHLPGSGSSAAAARPGITACRSMQQRTSSSKVVSVTRPASAGKSAAAGGASTASGVAGSPTATGSDAAAALSSRTDVTSPVQQLTSLSLNLDGHKQLAGAAVTDSSFDDADAAGSSVTPPLSERRHYIQETLDTLRSSIINLVGARSFDALYMLVNMTADQEDGKASSAVAEGGRPMSPEQHQLLKAVHKIVPEEKVAATVLPLMFKLMYHEHKLAEGVATN